MAMQPERVTVRSYNVGFGDCFLVGFHFDSRPRARTRYVLVDFGRQVNPVNQKVSMIDVAEDIVEQCGDDGLEAIVVTHRHQDHLSGFKGRSGKVLTDAMDDGFKIRTILQPWTEDPDVSEDATSPADRAFRAALSHMNETASQIHAISRSHKRHMSAALHDKLSFIGEDNVLNKEAVEYLMRFEDRRYLHYGKSTGLRIPGVRVTVLGPPTVDQHNDVQRQNPDNLEEYWHLHARSQRQVAEHSERGPFRHLKRRTAILPETRWFVRKMKQAHHRDLLSIATDLDDALNNTSLILLFECGDQKLLFPGDAQWENWSFALQDGPDTEKNKEKLANVTFYKVGHHGSLNGTPKTLWNGFERKSRDEDDDDRLISALSTRPGKHGELENDSEVPRGKLVNALRRDSELHNTDDLAPGDWFIDYELHVS